MTYLTTAQFIEQLQSTTSYHVYKIDCELPKLLLKKAVLGHPHQFIYDLGAQKLMVKDNHSSLWHSVFDNFNDIDDMQLLKLLSTYLPNSNKGRIPKNLPKITIEEKGPLK